MVPFKKLYIHDLSPSRNYVRSVNLFSLVKHQVLYGYKESESRMIETIHNLEIHIFNFFKHGAYS